MGNGSTHDPEQGGTLGERAEFADALESERDFPARAAAIHAQLVVAGVPDGASLLEVGCAGGQLLSALQEWYTVAGCDPYEARLVLARKRLTGVPLRQCAASGVTAESPAEVVIFAGTERLRLSEIPTALEAISTALAPDGVLLLLAGPTPDTLSRGEAIMDTFDGDGLKLVRSVVVRRSGTTARLAQHWMVARDYREVESFIENHTLHLHAPEILRTTLTEAGLTATHIPCPPLEHGLWLARRYHPSDGKIE